MVRSRKIKNKSPLRKIKHISNELEPLHEPLPGYQHRIEDGIEWTPNEVAMRTHIKHYHDREPTDVMFGEAFEVKLRKSDLQPFLDNISGTFREKIDILSLKLWELNENASEGEKLCHELNNNLIDDIEFRLQEMVKQENISLEELLTDVKVIRVMDSKINKLDRSLQQHHHLLILNLGINYLNTWEWKFVPRTLRVLNLHANFINDVSLFANKTCPNLVSLVLSRNYLNDESNFLVEELCQINDLDLADNDILWPTSVLEALSRFPKLTSLTLRGNPFAVSRNYKTIVNTALPKLLYLDLHDVKPEVKGETSIAKRKAKSPKRSSRKSARSKRKSPKKSQRSRSSSKKSRKGEQGDQPDAIYFIFSCYRIMGLPPLPKGEVGTFHLEMYIPLLDPVRREFLMFNEIPTTEASETREEQTEPSQNEKSKTPNADISLIKTRIDDSQIQDIAISSAVDRTLEIGDNNKSPRILQHIKSTGHEHSLEDSSCIYKKLELYTPDHLHQKAFETSRVGWSKIITFPAVKISCHDLFALRDTFRTVITIKLIYTKGSDKKKRKKKDTKRNSLSPDKKLNEEWRCILATFRCQLCQPQWNKDSQDFHWSADLASPYALDVMEDNFSKWQFGDITNLSRNKKEKGKKKSKSPDKTKKSGKKKKEKQSSGADSDSLVKKAKENMSNINEESRPIPTSLTIHVGFGVERLN